LHFKISWSRRIQIVNAGIRWLEGVNDIAKPNLRLVTIAFLSATILFSFTASVVLPGTFIQPARAQTPGQLPQGVTPDETIFTTANLTLRPNPIGVGQNLIVNMLISPAPGPDRTLQGFLVRITKPSGSTDTIGPINAYSGSGNAWFQYVVDQGGLWKFNFQFSGMYFPAGRYYNGNMIANSSSNGTFYSKSAYYTPSLVPDQELTVQGNPVPTSTFQISPSSGTAGATANITASGFPTLTPVSIYYQDPDSTVWRSWSNGTTNSTGGFTIPSQMPDLRKSLNAYDQYEAFTYVWFRADIAGGVYGYTSYNEYMRGLKRVGNYTAVGLFGNNTNTSYYVKVQPGDKLTLSGKWFSQGTVNVKWDGFPVVATVTANDWRNAQIIGTTVANSTGYFEVNATIPNAAVGEHYVAVEDSQTTVVIKVSAQSSPTVPEMPNGGWITCAAIVIVSIAGSAGMVLKKNRNSKREP
jgi:hypothetical protein